MIKNTSSRIPEDEEMIMTMVFPPQSFSRTLTVLTQKPSCKTSMWCSESRMTIYMVNVGVYTYRADFNDAYCVREFDSSDLHQKHEQIIL